MRWNEYDPDRHDIATSRLEPPMYPFPGERIIHSSARNAPDFVIGEDSWFALAELDEPRLHLFGDKEHRNPYRFTVHTPQRGSTSMFMNHGDLETLLLLSLAGMYDDGTYMNEDDELQISKSWIDHLLPDDIEVTFVE